MALSMGIEKVTVLSMTVLLKTNGALHGCSEKVTVLSMGVLLKTNGALHGCAEKVTGLAWLFC